jgi:hypothetical protein
MALGIAGIVVHLIPLFRDLGAELLAAANIAFLSAWPACSGTWRSTQRAEASAI